MSVHLPNYVSAELDKRFKLFYQECAKGDQANINDMLRQLEAISLLECKMTAGACKIQEINLTIKASIQHEDHVESQKNWLVKIFKSAGGTVGVVTAVALSMFVVAGAMHGVPFDGIKGGFDLVNAIAQFITHGSNALGDGAGSGDQAKISSLDFAVKLLQKNSDESKEIARAATNQAETLKNQSDERQKAANSAWQASFNVAR